ncbi:hypothetical protein CLOP_g20122 [Closterium sp. NIES-67]|nr:hypothetical protein CLOP_g19972 [Closterium sp. NIES-67]GJP63046.1 hypothetical protein CLOP_g20122 [Closterium sp. NIES-67]
MLHGAHGAERRLNFPHTAATAVGGGIHMRPVVVSRATAESLLRAARNLAAAANGASTAELAGADAEVKTFSSEWVQLEIAGANVLFAECPAPGLLPLAPSVAPAVPTPAPAPAPVPAPVSAPARAPAAPIAPVSSPSPLSSVPTLSAGDDLLVASCDNVASDNGGDSCAILELPELDWPEMEKCPSADDSALFDEIEKSDSARFDDAFNLSDEELFGLSSSSASVSASPSHDSAFACDSGSAAALESAFPFFPLEDEGIQFVPSPPTFPPVFPAPAAPAVPAAASAAAEFLAAPPSPLSSYGSVSRSVSACHVTPSASASESGCAAAGTTSDAVSAGSADSAGSAGSLENAQQRADMLVSLVRELSTITAVLQHLQKEHQLRLMLQQQQQ